MSDMFEKNKEKRGGRSMSEIPTLHMMHHMPDHMSDHLHDHLHDPMSDHVHVTCKDKE